MSSNKFKFTRRKFLGGAFSVTLPIALFSFPLLSAGESLTTKFFASDASDSDDLKRLEGLLKQKDPLIWVFTGDSITLGAKHTHGYHCYPEVFEERVRWEIARYRDIVINTGMSGHTTKDILNDFNWRVVQFKPSVVSLMFGTNDCKNDKWGISLESFEQNLKEIILKIRSLGAIAVLHTPPIVIKEKSLGRIKLPEYVSVIQKIANDEKLILIDNWSYWKDTLENHPEINVYKNWLNDPNHPNAAGHLEIARLMFKKLSIYNPADQTCGGKYYEGDH